MSGVHGGDLFEYEKLREAGVIEPAPPIPMDLHVTVPEPDRMTEVYELRYEVLREPVGVPRGFESDEADELDDTVHAVVLGPDGGIVSTGRAHQAETPHEYQLRFMATAEAYRNKGLGKKVLGFIEAEVKTRGGRQIVANARVDALSLYTRSGYSAENEVFEIHGIPHVKISKLLEVWAPLSDEARYYDPQYQVWRGPLTHLSNQITSGSTIQKGASFEA